MFLNDCSTNVRKMCYFFTSKPSRIPFSNANPSVWCWHQLCRTNVASALRPLMHTLPCWGKPCLKRFSLVYSENLIPKNCPMSYLTKWTQQSVLQNFPLNFIFSTWRKAGFRLHWTENSILDRTDSSLFQRIDKPAYLKASPSDLLNSLIERSRC